MQRESFLQSIIVATCLCIVCSVLVSTAAVVLKPLQKANKQRQLQQQVLSVAGLYEEGKPIDEQFKQVEAKVIDLRTGEYVDPDSLDAKAYDIQSPPTDPELSEELSDEDDVAGLKHREKYTSVFLVKDSQGKLQQLILPVRGKGLWSTMYGLLSLKPPDFREVNGITFYEHGETPGLGGEIESEKFRQQWEGKLVRGKDGKAEFDIVRGSDDAGDHEIDAIAGATITSRGVINMIRFWMGPEGYKPFLERLASGNVAAEANNRRDASRRLARH